MKRKLFFFATLVLSFLVVSCSNEDQSVISVEKEQSELIKIGYTFGKIHNECLAHVYARISETNTRVTIDDKGLRETIIAHINEFVASNVSTRSTDIDVSQIDTISIAEIRASLTDKEEYYIGKAITLQRDPALDELLDLVDGDTELPEKNKLAVICFITTLKASTEYWDEHLDEWMELFNIPRTRGWKEVAFADAWWGYQGMISSGLNPWIGGGTAALASGATLLFG